MLRILCVHIETSSLWAVFVNKDRYPERITAFIILIIHIIVSFDQNISMIFFVKGGSHVSLWHPSSVYFTAKRQYTVVQKMRTPLKELSLHYNSLSNPNFFIQQCSLLHCWWKNTLFMHYAFCWTTFSIELTLLSTHVTWFDHCAKINYKRSLSKLTVVSEWFNFQKRTQYTALTQ